VYRRPHLLDNKLDKEQNSLDLLARFKYRQGEYDVHVVISRNVALNLRIDEVKQKPNQVLQQMPPADNEESILSLEDLAVLFRPARVAPPARASPEPPIYTVPRPPPALRRRA
jgi:hypothetical protein